ncbi:MAG TPA: toll/interleukin-1 receptor domain-containing protein [Thermoanaerobaculia bacterium]|nr:toll/interleukin-1 receptor domain-containing protein [Thermoanaerobaculia bacterium]
MILRRTIPRPHLRSRRVFIAYSRDEKTLRDGLVQWLEERGFDPDYDDKGGGMLGERLTLGVAEKIQQSECLIALGTRKSLASDWVQQEVVYAQKLPRKRFYFPVLAEEIPKDEIPPWFRLEEAVVGDVGYEKCLGGDYSNLAAPMERVRRGFPVTLRAAVTVALVLLTVVPLLICLGLRNYVDVVDSDTKKFQNLIERANETTDPVDAEALLAKDSYEHGDLVRREYFSHDGIRVAVDDIVTERAPNGAIAKVKTRRMFAGKETGLLVEDLFDSEGILISKRVRSSADEPWRYYVDETISLYPLMAPYR